MRIIREKLAASLCVLLLCGAPLAASAKVSEAEAEKLGKELTPLAEPRGSKDGTIPEWKGAAIFNDEQKHYTFAKLQLRVLIRPPEHDADCAGRGGRQGSTITAQNYTQYADI